MKKCIKCQQEKGLLNFGKDKRRKDGLSNYCKNCIRARDAKSYRKNAEKVKARNERYRKRNPEVNRASQAKYRKANPEKVKASYLRYRKKAVKDRKQKRHIAFLKREGLLEFEVATVITNLFKTFFLPKHIEKKYIQTV